MIEDRDEHDAPAWQDARSVEDMGRLTAQWLTGELHWCPMYFGTGPDPETDDLVPVLAAINRLGLWTTMSQPGESGRQYAQRAMLSGYCTEATSNALAAGLLNSELLVVRIEEPEATNSQLQVPITISDGVECTWAGGLDELEHYREDLDDAVVDALAAQQLWAVELIDMTWGRNDVLWPAVTDALTQRPVRKLASYSGDGPPPAGIEYVDV